MIKYTEIAKKIRSMSAHEIIMAMVEGLRNPKTKIDMNVYVAIRYGICFGCAATNAILHIMDANEEEVGGHFKYRTTYDDYTLWGFERAINMLRRGSLDFYNSMAKGHGFVKITPIPGQKLPILNNDYTEDELQEYVKLAEYNKIKEA